MKLVSLELRNIRSYTSCSIAFPTGSLLLSGDIGSGKSTILSAIEFALFGIIRGALEGSGLLRHGANTGSVTLMCVINGADVVIHRTLERSAQTVNQGNGYLVINGSQEQLTPTEIRARVFDLLGYPADQLARASLLFRYTVYTPQERMKEIVTGDTQTRLQILRSLFGIDKYHRAYDNAGIVISALRQVIFGKESQLKLLEEQSNALTVQLAKHKEATEALGVAKDAVDRAKKQVDVDQQAYDEHFKKYEEIVKAKQKEDEIAKTIVQLKTQQIDLVARKKERDDKIMLLASSAAISVVPTTDEQVKISKEKLFIEQKKYDDAVRLHTLQLQEQARLHTTIIELRKQIVTPIVGFSEEISRLEEKISVRKTIEQKIFTLEQDFVRMQSQVLSLQAQLKDADTKNQSILSLETCPTCLQKIDEHHKSHIASETSSAKTVLKQQLSEVSRDLDGQKILIDEEKKTIRQLDQFALNLKELQVKEQQRLSDVAKQQKINIDVAAAEKKLSDLKQSAKSPSDELRIAAQKEYDQIYERYVAYTRKMQYDLLLKEQSLLQNDIDAIASDLARRQSELTALLPQSQSFATSRQTLLSLQERVKASQEKLREAAKQAERNQAIVAQFEQLRVQQKSLDDQATLLKTEVSILESKRSVLSGSLRELLLVIERHVMISIYREFNAIFSSWAKMLIDDETTSLRLDNEFSPYIEQDGFDVSLDQLSGGERTSVALAYRLSLHRVVNSMIENIATRDIIILDEPTDGFSSEQLDKVRAVLALAAVKQVVIVSHEAKVRTFVDTIISVRKEGSISTLVAE